MDNVHSMQNIITRWLDPHYRCPQGWLGRYVGHLMTVQHVPELQWTLDVLSVHPTSRVLEIGFGAGNAINVVAARVPDGHVSGIDLSATMVRVARRRNSRWIQQGRVDLEQGTIARLPFADQAFDSAFSIHTVYFWPDIHQACSELWRVLAPAGRLVVTLTPGTLTAPDTSIGMTEREQELMAEMRQVGFSTVSRLVGPPSRQFAVAAIIGVK